MILLSVNHLSGASVGLFYLAPTFKTAPGNLSPGSRYRSIPLHHPNWITSTTMSYTVDSGLFDHNWFVFSEDVIIACVRGFLIHESC